MVVEKTKKQPISSQKQKDIHLLFALPFGCTPFGEEEGRGGNEKGVEHTEERMYNLSLPPVSLMGTKVRHPKTFASYIVHAENRWELFGRHRHIITPCFNSVAPFSPKPVRTRTTNFSWMIATLVLFYGFMFVCLFMLTVYTKCSFMFLCHWNFLGL